jgi:hypothetical protein
MGYITGYELMDTILPIIGLDYEGKHYKKVVLTMDADVARVDVTILLDITTRYDSEKQNAESIKTFYLTEIKPTE